MNEYSIRKRISELTTTIDLLNAQIEYACNNDLNLSADSLDDFVTEIQNLTNEIRRLISE